ncbi:unnamed protein product [Peniophora sp. CBMAI 1063]|nr:unnamed protein product [Peniophora sp. CBMAI 1063]
MGEIHEINPDDPADDETTDPSIQLAKLVDTDPDRFGDPRTLGTLMWMCYEGHPDDIAWLDRSIRATQAAVLAAIDSELEEQAVIQADLGTRLEARFKVNSSLDDLHGAVSAFRAAVSLTPDGHPNQVARLYQLSVSFLLRFDLLGVIQDLDGAATVLCCANELLPLDHSQKPVTMSGWGAALFERFKRNKVREDLEDAIAAFRGAIELMSDDNPAAPSAYNNLGHAHLLSFKLDSNLVDLEGAASAHSRAAVLTPNDHPLKPTGELGSLERAAEVHQLAIALAPDGHALIASHYHGLGNVLVAQFKRTGELHDLERAIRAHRNAVERSQDGRASHASYVADLGSALLLLESTDKLSDLEQAVSTCSHAVELLPDDHPRKPSQLNILGNVLVRHFNRTGELPSIQRAISARDRAVDLFADNHPDKPLRLAALGDLLVWYARRTGKLELIDRAVLVWRRAVDLTPDGHTLEPSRTCALGDALLIRFQHTGMMEDIEQAILAHRRSVELSSNDQTLDEPTKVPSLGDSLLPDPYYAVQPTSADRGGKATFVNSFGCSLLALYERSGEWDDLEQAISAHRQNVESTRDDHPSKPIFLTNYASSLASRFHRTGDLQDLELAISMQRSAVQFTLSGSPRMQGQLNNLGGLLIRYFERTGELQDIKSAISAFQRAIELNSEDYPERSLLFTNLGNASIRLFEMTGVLADLEACIAAHQNALDITPDGHPDKPAWYNHICNAYRRRFERTEDLDDIESAISAGRRAVELTPEGHANQFQCLNSLAAGLLRRAEAVGDHTNLAYIIDLFEKALTLAPEGDPFRSSSLKNLGIAQQALFEHSKTQDDFDAAVRSYMTSTMQKFSNPSVRLQSAIQCASLLFAHPTFSSDESLLSAHSQIIAVLPEIVWLGHGVRRRFDESAKLGDLVNAAVAAAISANALEQAVEWLEAGRALIWSQVLSLRTPLDELHLSHPDLAASLQDIQQELRLSAHTSYAPDIVNFAGVVGVSVNSQADHHRRLVIRYDDLLKKIRACDGFEDYLRPRRFATLVSPSNVLQRGPVVFLNVHASRCDALVLRPDASIASIALPDLTLDRARTLQSLWKQELSSVREQSGLQPTSGVDPPQGAPENAQYRHTSRIVEDEDSGHRVLANIWSWIVEPVLKAPHMTPSEKQNELQHIIWCPTGPLTQLPLHAAGIYDESGGPRVFDTVISSYTPSLSALLRCCEGLEKERTPPSVLMVTQPNTPGQSALPATREEGRRLGRILNQANVASTLLEHDRATKAAVRDAMNQHSWVHLACHGQQYQGDAARSAFALYDGSLSLSDLMGAASDNAELAFLSACQTAKGDATNPEESAHLAAGMLAVGFKGVVATMWSIYDADAPVVVEAFYNELLAARMADDDQAKGTGAAYALHEATRVLREKVGAQSFMRWVPFVHFGV